jgi:crotonobetainyl-CoA:carnitine CoA-transferase CaiB-like acyl-CoA transferase
VGFLDGLRVIDATRLLPGGYATMLLSDMGAEVVKVEQPGLGDYMRATPPTKGDESPVHWTVNRNKKSIGIDLKAPAGKRVLRKLLSRSDVFLEGFRPGAMDRLGFSFEQVRRVNPRIVYCSISAFGHVSPLSAMPGHDINFQATAGTLAYPRRAEVPLLQLSDMVAGALAATSILGALVRRKGAVRIDVPIVQSLLSWLVIPAAAYIVGGESPTEGHSLLFGSTPYYNLYRTSDGGHIAVAAVEEEFWHNLVISVGVPEVEGKRFGSEAERREATDALRAAFATKTRDEWAAVLQGKNTCATPVLSVAEALGSDWAKDSSMLMRVGGGVVLGDPVGVSPRKRKGAFTAAPSLGADTDAIMKALGYTRREVSRLKMAGVLQ